MQFSAPASKLLTIPLWSSSSHHLLFPRWAGQVPRLPALEAFYQGAPVPLLGPRAQGSLASSTHGLGM